MRDGQRVIEQAVKQTTLVPAGGFDGDGGERSSLQRTNDRGDADVIVGKATRLLRALNKQIQVIARDIDPGEQRGRSSSSARDA